MREPTVACILLVDGRREMTARALRSFRSQTYDPTSRWIILFDSGAEQFRLAGGSDSENEIHIDARAERGATIGKLRNEANAMCGNADIIVHMDSDDWSHPRRIEEQVALLVASGKQCVGYREVLFWDTRHVGWPKGCTLPYADEELVERPEAWLYSSPDPRYVIGASMCYWRSAWVECPFDDAPHEDQRWWLKNASKCLGVSAMASVDDEPRLVCQIHSGNTSPAYSAELMAHSEWRRAPDFDNYAAERMKL